MLIGSPRNAYSSSEAGATTEGNATLCTRKGRRQAMNRSLWLVGLFFCDVSGEAHETPRPMQAWSLVVAVSQLFVTGTPLREAAQTQPESTATPTKRQASSQPWPRTKIRRC